MKLIKRGAAVLGVLVGLFLVTDLIRLSWIPTSTITQQPACYRKAERFLIEPAGGEAYQTFTPFNGLDDGAWALAVRPNGSLVVGGEFTHAGGIAARHIALWKADTRTWQTIGEGLPDPVHELVSTPRGDLYALTRFKPEYGPSTIKIYRWRNDTWEPLPELFAGPAADPQEVEAMLWDGQDGFFLGGNFSAAGGLAVNGLIHWNGQAWLPLKGDLPEKGLFLVRALVLAADGRLVAGGTLKTAGGRLDERVLAWEGDRWSKLGEALPGPVESLAGARSGRLAALVARLDGAKYISWVRYTLPQGAEQWTPDPQAFPLSDVEFQVINDTEKVGIEVKPLDVSQSELADWEGSFWQARVNPFRLEYDRKRPIRLYLARGKAYVLGVFDQMGGAAAENIAMWDGRAWSGLAPADKPVNDLSGAIKTLAVDHQGNLIAGGSFQTAGTSLTANIARWDGTGWYPLGGGLNNTVNTLAIDEQDRVYAGGYFTQVDGIKTFAVARYDPASGTWEALASRESPGFAMVRAMAFAPDGTLYAAGQGVSFGQTGYFVSAWDGRQWKALPGIFDREIQTLLVDHQGRVFAGGSFLMVSGEPVVGVARWDQGAGRWLNLGSGLGWTSPGFAFVNSLLQSPDGAVIVGGNFTTVNGAPVCHVARLLADANEGKGKWEELAGGLPWLTQMAFGPDGSLYAATSLQHPNGQADHQLVMLPPGGMTWQLIGGIIGEPHSPLEVNALAVSPQGWLAVAGVFELAGEQPVHNIAFLKLPGK